MKKLILIASSTLLFSCQKEHCYECTQTTSYRNTLAPEISGEPYILCGYTKKEIKEHQDSAYIFNDFKVISISCETLKEE